MFYRFQYEVSYRFNDAISALPINARLARMKPTTFVGRARGELKVKSPNFDDARFIAHEQISGTTWGVRSIKGKAGTGRTRITGSEVLIGGNWYDTSEVCPDCLNGVPHKHDERLNIKMGNTEEYHGQLDSAA